jgi:hypothetical protein
LKRKALPGSSTTRPGPPALVDGLDEVPLEHGFDEIDREAAPDDRPHEQGLVRLVGQA